MSCGYLDIAHMSVFSWVDLSYSSNVPLPSGKIRLGKNNNVINTNISSVDTPLLPWNKSWMNIPYPGFSEGRHNLLNKLNSLSGIPASSEWPLGYPV